MSDDIYGLSAQAYQQLRELIRKEAGRQSPIQNPIRRKHVYPSAAVPVTVIIELSTYVLNDAGSEEFFVLSGETNNIFRPQLDENVSFGEAFIEMKKKSDISASAYFLTITKTGYYEFEFTSEVQINSEQSSDDEWTFQFPVQQTTDSGGSPSHTHTYYSKFYADFGSWLSVFLKAPDVSSTEYWQMCRREFFINPYAGSPPQVFASGPETLSGRWAAYIDLEDLEVESFRINLCASHYSATPIGKKRQAVFRDYSDGMIFPPFTMQKKILLKITRYASRPDQA